MKILLIVHDIHQEDNRFPLWAGYLAAVLEKQGHKVTIFNADVYHFSNKVLAIMLNQNNFDMIGLSFMASRFKETIVSLCDTIVNNKKQALFVVGGHCPSAIPEYILKTIKADVVVIGEAEESVVELANGIPFEKIDGLAFLKEGELVTTPPRKLIKNLGDLPHPAWHLFPIAHYATSLKLFHHEPLDRYIDIITSRGCVNKCNFCYRLEPGYRMRPIKDVVKEMRLLNGAYGINYFEIMDEMFIISKDRLRELKNELGSLRIKYCCDGRVNFLDEEILGLLADTGCQFLNFGFESMNQRVLDLMGKHTTVEQNERAARLTKESGIGLGLNFIWGNKGDTKESLKENVDFIKRYNTYVQLRTIKPVTPYPGCDLYYEAIDRGLISGPEDFFNRFKNADLITINFTEMSNEECYDALFAANKELIQDHCAHTGEPDVYTKRFYNLYYNNDIANFRGVRNYTRSEQCTRD